MPWLLVRPTPAAFLSPAAFLCALAIAFALLAPATGFGAARFDFASTPGRLPKDVVPTLYRLSFELDPAADTFAGRTEIEVVVGKPVTSITLNARELQATSVRLRDSSGTERELAVSENAAGEQWRLSWAGTDADKSTLAPGRYTLHLEYRGKVQRTGQALFRVDYVADGKPAQMLATQLQPTYARRLFPNFDEPAFRARFDIEIVTGAALEPVSNMPVAGQVNLPDGRKRTRFERTPSMPTYLVAVAVGDFDALEDRFDNVPLRILTARGRKQEAVYAMGVTKQLLGWFRDYFDIPYMLPKLDQIAVPGTRHGAMEDWGAISYNENLLLFDLQRSPPRQRETIFYLVAHEIAHQWFGNLVTAAWWDHIWLNEAFATWIGAKAMHQLHPEWKSDLRKRQNLEAALARDAGTATRAMDEPPASETEIVEVFDDITYEKGGSVLGMFEAHLGADVFRDGLRRYLKAHAYSNGTAGDLWFHLSQAAGRDVTSMVSQWTARPGVPLVVAHTVCRGGRTEVALRQERFTGFGVPPESGVPLPVPVRINAAEQSRALVLWRQPKRVSFDGCVPVIANGGDLGYYRVLYDRANFARLRAAYTRLAAPERSGLIADTFALVRAGRQPLAEYLSLLTVLRDEPEGAIWQQVIDDLEYLDEAFVETEAQHGLRARGRALLAPKLVQLGWQPRASDAPGTVRLRNALIHALGRFDDEATIQRARRQFRAMIEGEAIEPSIRSGIVHTVARHADAATFDELRAKLKAAGNQEDDYLYGGALIGVRDAALVQRLLDLTLTDEWAPGSATWYVREIGNASGHAQLAQEFVLRNFEALSAKASTGARPWLLPRAYAGFSVAARADELLAVQRKMLGVDAMGPAEQVAFLIREKAGLREREAARLQGTMRHPSPPARRHAS